MDAETLVGLAMLGLTFLSLPIGFIRFWKVYLERGRREG